MSLKRLYTASASVALEAIRLPSPGWLRTWKRQHGSIYWMKMLTAAIYGLQYDRSQKSWGSVAPLPPTISPYLLAVEWPILSGIPKEWLAARHSALAKARIKCMAHIQTKSSALYMMESLNAQLVKEHSFDDAVMLDLDGNIVECTGANIFFLKDGKAVTPSSAYALNEITRQTVIELLSLAGIDILRYPVWPGAIARFDEVFMTDTAYEIQRTASIEASRLL